jgi:PEP-CTERM motif
MRIKLLLSVACASLVLMTTQVAAQQAPISRIVPVTFTGVVANDVTNEILIRQPNGTYAPFQGPVPEYPYKKGDTVKLSFNATLPTQAFYQPDNPAYGGKIAVDGLYRIRLVAQEYAGGGVGIGVTRGLDVSGPISPASNFGQPNNMSMTIVYDSNADTYSIDFSNGGFSSGVFIAPGYTYDANTGALTNCSGRCAPVPEDNNTFGIGSRGTADTLTSEPIGIYGTAPGLGYDSGNVAGLFRLIFSGSWNLPTFGSGGATQVPEPGMMLLFAGGVGALAARRRARKADSPT